MIVETILASVAVAALSLLGVLLFGTKGHLTGTNRYILPIAIGVFLGVVFFELIPETILLGGALGSIAIAGGFLAFYLLTHLLHTYHHHHDKDSDDGCHNKAGASLLLIGDGIHNLTDGVVIASAFLINPAVGIATTIGVALHEIPQEIAEFGVLLKAGYSKRKAALYNFLSASSVILGAILTLIFAEYLGEYIWILTGVAAGNLLYIAASDFIPDVQHEQRTNGTFLNSFMMTIFGLVAITLLISWAHGEFGNGHEHGDHGHATEHTDHDDDELVDDHHEDDDHGHLD